MRKWFKVLPPDKTAHEIAKPSMEDMQRLVGGYFELVRIDGYEIYCNDAANVDTKSYPGTIFKVKNGEVRLLGNLIIKGNPKKVIDLLQNSTMTEVGTKQKADWSCRFHPLDISTTSFIPQ